MPGCGNCNSRKKKSRRPARRTKEPLIKSGIPVIASVARQSRDVASAGWRLPRRYAPRNDDLIRGSLVVLGTIVAQLLGFLGHDVAHQVFAIGLAHMFIDYRDLPGEVPVTVTDPLTVNHATHGQDAYQ